MYIVHSCFMCGSEYVQLFIVYSPPVFSGVCVPQSLSLICNVWKIVVCPFVLFLLAIVLSVVLRYTASDYTLLHLQTFLILVSVRQFISVIAPLSHCSSSNFSYTSICKAVHLSHCSSSNFSYTSICKAVHLSHCSSSNFSYTSICKAVHLSHCSSSNFSYTSICKAVHLSHSIPQ